MTTATAFEHLVTATKTAADAWETRLLVVPAGAGALAEGFQMHGAGTTLATALGALRGSIDGFVDGLETAAAASGGLEADHHAGINALHLACLRAGIEVAHDHRRAMFHGERARLCSVKLTA